MDFGGLAIKLPASVPCEFIRLAIGPLRQPLLTKWTDHRLDDSIGTSRFLRQSSVIIVLVAMAKGLSYRRARQ